MNLVLWRDLNDEDKIINTLQMSNTLLITALFAICSFQIGAQVTGSFEIEAIFDEVDYDFDRMLYYYVPSDYDESLSYPLVVGFRGGPHSNAGQFRDQLTFLADSLGAIVLCPENEDHFWNNEGLTKQLFQYSVELTQEMYSIDPNFIYLTGLSYGGRHAVIVSMDTDDGDIPQLRGVIPFAAGSEADLQPNYDSVEEFAPACVCIGLNDSQNFISVSNNLVDDITSNGGDAYLNEIPNVGHTVVFADYKEEMMECFNFIESQYSVTSVVETILEQSTKIYPNPTSQILTLDLGDTSPTQMYLSELDGTLIKQFAKQVRTISVAELPSGTYLLTIESAARVETQQVIIK